MDQWKLWFVLLLPLCLCFDSEDILVKTIGSEPDVTPICTNATLSIITLIVCKISTERNGGAECRLLYGHGWDFVHECDSRFTLKTKNQTVFLHLTSLKPEDRGNYTCECSHLDGVYILHLNITVEAASHEQDFSSSFFRILPIIVIGGVTASIIVIGLVLKGILRKIHSRDDTRSAASGLTVCEPPCSLTGNDEREREKRISHVTNVPRSMDLDDPDDPYTSLQQPTNDLYQTISSVQHQHDTMRNSACNILVTAHLDQEIDGRETDPSCKIYENI